MFLLRRMIFISIAIIGAFSIREVQAETDGFYCGKLTSSVSQTIAGVSVSSCQEFPLRDGSNRREIIAHLIFPKEPLALDYTRWNPPSYACGFTTWNPSRYLAWWNKLPESFWTYFQKNNEIESSECIKSSIESYPLPSCLYYQDFSKVSYSANVTPTLFEVTSYTSSECPLTADNTRSEVVRLYTTQTNLSEPRVEVQPPKQDCKDLEGSFLVKNSGVPSNNSFDLLNRLRSSILNVNPKVVILMVGTNDILNPKKILPLGKYKENISQIVDEVTKCSKVVIASIPPVDPKAFSKRNQVKDPNRKITELNKVIKNLAIEKNIPIVDIYKEFTSKKPVSKVIGKDGLHPNADGYRVISKIVYKVLTQQNLPKDGIVCFGDSITKGIDGNNYHNKKIQPYPLLLEKLLNR